MSENKPEEKDEPGLTEEELLRSEGGASMPGGANINVTKIIER